MVVGSTHGQERARRTVVISQPMFFPWVGFLEQLALADELVVYDDVQFSKGSFTNRVQLKTAHGSEWLTLPLRGLSLGQAIRDVRVDERAGFRRKHLTTLEQRYARAPHQAAMMKVAERVYAVRSDWLVDIAQESTLALVEAFGLCIPAPRIASSLGVAGRSSERVLAVVTRLGGTHYVTGHGAKAYLDHEAFDRAGVSVEYMSYRKEPYRQLFGAFTPYVSALDLLANEGPAGARFICSGAVPWRAALGNDPSPPVLA